MNPYTTKFLKQGTDNETYSSGTKTYFPPWWRFWDRKVKSECSGEGDWIREFDREGNVVSLSKKRSVLSSTGFGSRYYWETLDVKTNNITAEPRPGHKVLILPDGKCQESFDYSDGGQEVTWGFINGSGENEPHVRLIYRNGKQVACKWLKGNHSSKIWKDILKEYPVNLEERAKKLTEVVEKYRQGKETPSDEAELRAFKDDEERAKAKARHGESKIILTRVRVRQRRSGR